LNTENNIMVNINVLKLQFFEEAIGTRKKLVI